MNKLIGIFFLAATAAAVVLNAERLEMQFAPLPDKFTLIMKQDLQLLLEKKVINKEFFDSRKVTYFAHTPLTKALIHKSRALAGNNQESPYRIEVAMHEWEDEGELGVTVTFSIFEVETDNKVNEFGRTYIIMNEKKTGAKKS